MPNGGVAEELLKSTPYLISDGTASAHKFERILDKAQDVQDKAERVGRLIHEQASDVFEAFGLVLRSELVAESNKIEHINWSAN